MSPRHVLPPGLSLLTVPMSSSVSLLPIFAALHMDMFQHAFLNLSTSSMSKLTDAERLVDRD